MYYSSSNNVVDLIDSLSRNLDQGRFDIIPTSGLGAPRSEEEEPHVYHPRQGNHVGEVRHLGTPLGLPTSSSDRQGKSRTVEERLQVSNRKAIRKPNSDGRHFWIGCKLSRLEA